MAPRQQFGRLKRLQVMPVDVMTLLSATAEPEAGTADLADLFQSHHQRLYRLARRLSTTTEDSHDLVQDTFVRAAQNPGSVPSGLAAQEAWLVRVLVNLCRDRWRHDKIRHAATVLNRVSDQARSDEARFIAHDTVWRALHRLPVRRRAILVMCELEGLSIASTAQLLGITAVTVRWHLSRGRRELAQAIKREQ